MKKKVTSSTLRPTKANSGSVNAFMSGDVWRSFVSLENELGEFIEFVPLEKRNQNVFSPRLGTILMSSCVQIEALFKSIINSPFLDREKSIAHDKLNEMRQGIARQRGNLAQYREVLEPCLLLSKRKVTIREFPKVYKVVSPFRLFEKMKAPTWWKSYTQVKHSFYENIREATLRRTITAVAALLVMELMHPDNRKVMVDMGMIKSGFRGSQEHVFARPFLKELICSYSNPSIPAEKRVNTWSTSAQEVWVETKFFDVSILPFAGEKRTR